MFIPPEIPTLSAFPAERKAPAPYPLPRGTAGLAFSGVKGYTACNPATSFRQATELDRSDKGVCKMQKQICLIVALCVAISEIGCQSKSDSSNGNPNAVTNGQQLDFEALLTSVDNAIGKRFQSMQMDAMESATYQYGGPIQTVLDIVAPIAKKSGFSEATVGLANDMGAAEQEMQKKLGIDMKSVEQKMFTHPSGDTLMVSRMDISNEGLDMKMLTIQLMNPKKMADFGKSMKQPSSPPQHTQNLVNSWADMGMHLPSQEQVDFLHSNLSDVTPELEAAVSHKNPDVRQRAAYVISKIGTDAKASGKPLFEQLKKEPEQLVQIYLIDALGAIRFTDDEVIAFLEKKYDSLSDDNVPPNLFGGKYAEVDEKINLAGVLYVLTEPKSRDKYLGFVTQWLQPPSGDMSPVETGGYWERRWMAVNSLEGMEGATVAIPLLDALLKEENGKSWVSVHVPRVLGVLKSQGGPVTK
jgi:hypothetical protein